METLWRLGKPEIEFESFLNAIVKRMQNSRDRPDLKNRIIGAKDRIANNSEVHRKYVDADNINVGVVRDLSVPLVFSHEMIWVYENRFAKQDRPGRFYYDYILSRAIYQRCAYCQEAPAETLDHFIPKSIVPILSIEPLNLVPACFSCNHALASAVDSGEAQRLIHPYTFPPIIPDEIVWLSARVVSSDGVPIVIFEVADLGDDYRSLQGRIEYQFYTLGLDEKYSDLSVLDLTETCRRLSELYPGGGLAGEVRDFLNEKFDEYSRTGNNYRKVALYRALRDSAWFVEGAYENYPQPGV